MDWRAIKCLFYGHYWSTREDARTFCDHCFNEHRDSIYFQNKIFFVIRAIEEEFRIAEEKKAKEKVLPLKEDSGQKKPTLH